MPSGGWNKGILHSEETKQKIREKATGRPMHINCKEALAKANTGSHHTEEAKNKMSMAHSGEKNSFWKGGIYHRQGYIYVYHPDYPTKRIAQHRLIWESYNNKKLPKGWVIHHLNGIKDDNRPKNLTAMPRKDHNRIIEPYKKRIRELELELMRVQQLNLFDLKAQFEEKK